MNTASLSPDMIVRPSEKSADMHDNDNATKARRRRGLVLTDESAQHPFRASLPPHVKRDIIPIPAEDLWRLTKQDIRGVVSTYVATTAAVLAFII